MTIKEVLSLMEISKEDIRKLNRKEQTILSILVGIQEAIKENDTELLDQLIKEKVLLGFINRTKLPIITNNIQELIIHYNRIVHGIDLLTVSSKVSEIVDNKTLVTDKITDPTDIAKALKAVYPRNKTDGTLLTASLVDIVNRVKMFFQVYKDYNKVTVDKIKEATSKYVTDNTKEGYKYMFTLCNFIYNKDRKESKLAAYLEKAPQTNYNEKLG